MTTFDALSAKVSSLTKEYQWEGVVRPQAISLLEPLQTRKDLTVASADDIEERDSSDQAAASTV
jgi:hypothetical protein